MVIGFWLNNESHKCSERLSEIKPDSLDTFSRPLAIISESFQCHSDNS